MQPWQIMWFESENHFQTFLAETGLELRVGPYLAPSGVAWAIFRDTRNGVRRVGYVTPSNNRLMIFLR